MHGDAPDSVVSANQLAFVEWETPILMKQQSLMIAVFETGNVHTVY